MRVIFPSFRLSQNLPSSIDLLIQFFKNSKLNSHSFKVLTGISPPVAFFFFFSNLGLLAFLPCLMKLLEKKICQNFVFFFMFYVWMIFLFFNNIIDSMKRFSI